MQDIISLASRSKVSSGRKKEEERGVAGVRAHREKGYKLTSQTGGDELTSHIDTKF
jgi:hypothetical protein